MGFPVTVSMNLGMFVGWAVLSPLSKHLGWAPGPAGSNTDGARGWILWVALAIMIAESLTSLFPIVIGSITRSVSHARQNRRSRMFTPSSPDPRDSRDSVLRGDYYDGPLEGERGDDVDVDVEHEPEERLVPTSWVIWGLGGSGVLGVVLVWVVFGDEGIKPWATAVGLVLASGLAVVGVRALGETDINPVRPSPPHL